MCGLLLALGAPWSESWAEEKQRENPYIDKATQLREDLKYDKAFQMLEKAAKWPANTLEQAAIISLLEGVLRYETTNQPELAEPAFRRALSLAPEARIPLDVAPKITELLERIRAEVKAPIVVAPPRPPVVEPVIEITTPVAPEPTLGDRLAPYRVPVAIAGGGVAIVGALSWARAKSLEQQLRNGDASITTRAQLDATLSQGKTFETAGWILVGAGAAATLGSLLLLQPSGPTPAISAAPTQGGAQVSFFWSTP